jgi:hypothetical protein
MDKAVVVLHARPGRHSRCRVPHCAMVRSGFVRRGRFSGGRVPTSWFEQVRSTCTLGRSHGGRLPVKALLSNMRAVAKLRPGQDVGSGPLNWFELRVSRARGPTQGTTEGKVPSARHEGGTERGGVQ